MNILLIFLEKISLSVLDINGNIINFMAKFFLQIWQNWILSVHENFFKNLILRKKKFSWLSDIGRNKGDVLGKIFQQDCQNCTFGFQRNTLIEHIPWRSYFLLSLRELERKNVSFLAKDFQQGFESRILRVQGNILKRFFRRIFILELCWTLGENKNADLDQTFTAAL